MDPALVIRPSLPPLPHPQPSPPPPSPPPSPASPPPSPLPRLWCVFPIARHLEKPRFLWPAQARVVSSRVGCASFCQTRSPSPLTTRSPQSASKRAVHAAHIGRRTASARTLARREVADSDCRIRNPRDVGHIGACWIFVLYRISIVSALRASAKHTHLNTVQQGPTIQNTVLYLIQYNTYNTQYREPSQTRNTYNTHTSRRRRRRRRRDGWRNGPRGPSSYMSASAALVQAAAGVPAALVQTAAGVLAVPLAPSP